jgi:hypothetical protein
MSIRQISSVSVSNHNATNWARIRYPVSVLWSSRCITPRLGVWNDICIFVRPSKAFDQSTYFPVFSCFLKSPSPQVTIEIIHSDITASFQILVNLLFTHNHSETSAVQSELLAAHGSIATCYGLRVTPGVGFFSPPCCPFRSWGPPSLLSNGSRGLLSRW